VVKRRGGDANGISGMTNKLDTVSSAMTWATTLLEPPVKDEGCPPHSAAPLSAVTVTPNVFEAGLRNLAPQFGRTEPDADLTPPGVMP
jgi:hypothetical protein